MGYGKVTTTFRNGAAYTIKASEVNQNFTDLINMTSDGTKDIKVNNISCSGQHTITGYSKVGGSENIIIKEYTGLLTAADIANSGLYVADTLAPNKLRGSIATIYDVSAQISYCNINTTNGDANARVYINAYFASGTGFGLFFDSATFAVDDRYHILAIWAE